MSNFHLWEIQTLQNSLREREEYIIILEDRIQRLEVGDAALNYSIGLDLQKENDAAQQRIKELEKAGDAMEQWLSEYGPI